MAAEICRETYSKKKKKKKKRFSRKKVTDVKVQLCWYKGNAARERVGLILKLFKSLVPLYQRFWFIKIFLKIQHLVYCSALVRQLVMVARCLYKVSRRPWRRPWTLATSCRTLFTTFTLSTSSTLSTPTTQDLNRYVLFHMSDPPSLFTNPS